MKKWALSDFAYTVAALIGGAIGIIITYIRLKGEKP